MNEYSGKDLKDLYVVRAIMNNKNSASASTIVPIAIFTSEEAASKFTTGNMCRDGIAVVGFLVTFGREVVAGDFPLYENLKGG